METKTKKTKRQERESGQCLLQNFKLKLNKITQTQMTKHIKRITNLIYNVIQNTLKRSE